MLIAHGGLVTGHVAIRVVSPRAKDIGNDQRILGGYAETGRSEDVRFQNRNHQTKGGNNGESD
jgi:hypothetical protein